MVGVCSRVRTRGMQDLLPGKLGAAWPRVGRSTQFPRYDLIDLSGVGDEI